MRLRSGDVVVVPFPHTDLSSSKRRPALVVSPAWYNAEREDALVAYVTSVEQPPADPFSVGITNEDLSDGELVKPSWIRVDKLFMLEQSLVRKTVASLDEDTLEEVRRLAGALVRGQEPGKPGGSEGAE